MGYHADRPRCRIDDRDRGGGSKKLLKTGVLKIREGENCASKYGIDGK
jgi:hypothetical protein